jgi:hypothetical protein
VNTFEIIQEMRANPALAEELRAVLLTREVLEMPSRLARIEAALEELTAISRRHEERLAQHEERLARIEAALEELVAITRQHDERLGRVEAHVGRLNGWQCEYLWERNATAYLGTRRFYGAEAVPKAVLSRQLVEAVRAGRISAEEADDAILADGVHVATPMDAPDQAVYVVAEVAAHAHLDDLERARRRAEVIGRATSTRAVAVVVGADVDPLVHQGARDGELVLEVASWASAA